MIVACAFIQHTKPMMTYTNDTKISSLNVIHHHSPQVWEQLVGNEWWEAEYTHKLQAYKGHPKNEKFNYPG